MRGDTEMEYLQVMRHQTFRGGRVISRVGDRGDCERKNERERCEEF